MIIKRNEFTPEIFYFAIYYSLLTKIKKKFINNKIVFLISIIIFAN